MHLLELCELCKQEFFFCIKDQNSFIANLLYFFRYILLELVVPVRYFQETQFGHHDLTNHVKPGVQNCCMALNDLKQFEVH